MTLTEIKDQVAQESEYPTWDDLLDAIYRETELIENLSDIVAKRYALAAIEQDRKDCAAQAYEIEDEVPYKVVDKASILNRPYPELL